MKRLVLAALLGIAAAGAGIGSADGAEDPAAPALGIAGQQPDPTWELGTTGWGRAYSLQYPNAQIGGLREGLILNMTQYLAPLRDDGSPYSLRPYLQRTSWLSISADIGHFSTHNPFGAPDRMATWSDVGGSLSIYLKRWLAVSAGLSYEYNVLHDIAIGQSTHTLSGSAGVGFRAGDLRADVAYNASTYHQSGSAWSSPRRSVTVSLSSAIARRLTIDLSGTTLPAGFGGGLTVEYFPSPDVGVFSSGSAIRGHLYQSALMVARYVGSVGVAHWVDSSAAIVGRYSRIVEHVSEQVVDGLTYGDDETSNEVSLEVRVRFP